MKKMEQCKRERKIDYQRDFVVMLYVPQSGFVQSVSGCLEDI